MPTRPFTLYLQGGLGNQLFQACAYEYLSGLDGQACLVNPSLLSGISKSVTPRQIESEFLFDKEDLLPKRSPLFTGLLLRMQRLIGRAYVEHPDNVGAWHDLPDVRSRHLLGYFQDWQLVDSVWGSLQARLARNEVWRSIIEEPLRARVVVHYRLGDYVTNPVARRHHGVTHPRFFARLLSRIKEESPGIEIVVISDDCDLARALFSTFSEGCEATFSNGADPLKDLAIIGSSSSVIMSNSSFSWWGAWISSIKGGQIFAPTPWFARDKAHASLLPPEWREEKREVLSDADLEGVLLSIGRDLVGH